VELSLELPPAAAAVALAVAEAFADTADVLAGAVPFVYTFVGERGDYEVYSVHFSTFGLVVAVAGAIGAAAARRSHQGIFAGGIGCLIAYGIFGIDLVAPMVVIHLIFFLVLPCERALGLAFLVDHARWAGISWGRSAMREGSGSGRLPSSRTGR